MDRLLDFLLWLKQTFIDGDQDGDKIEKDFNRAIQIAENQETIISAYSRELKDAHAALRMIRDAVETLGPVGCIASGEQISCTPKHGHFLDEAEELTKGIAAIVEGKVL